MGKFTLRGREWTTIASHRTDGFRPKWYNTCAKQAHTTWIVSLTCLLPESGRELRQARVSSACRKIRILTNNLLRHARDITRRVSAILTKQGPHRHPETALAILARQSSLRHTRTVLAIITTRSSLQHTMTALAILPNHRSLQHTMTALAVLIKRGSLRHTMMALEILPSHRPLRRTVTAFSIPRHRSLTHTLPLGDDRSIHLTLLMINSHHSLRHTRSLRAESVILLGMNTLPLPLVLLHDVNLLRTRTLLRVLGLNTLPLPRVLKRDVNPLHTPTLLRARRLGTSALPGLTALLPHVRLLPGLTALLPRVRLLLGVTAPLRLPAGKRCSRQRREPCRK
mmetsp:Transcript_21724/g.38191  ORF Transcript_21724/g.38191 Transcript_21724/m.38191 type:complete len:340 (-) Transcript_21724:360-1379(-)